MRRLPFAPHALLLLIAATACRDAAQRDGERSDPSELAWPDEVPVPRPAASIEPPLACGTLRDVETADVLRADEGIAYYANEQTGLAIFDLRGPEPKLLSTSPFVGSPLAVFAHAGSAIVAFVDWERTFGADRVPSTILRQVNLRSAAGGRHPEGALNRTDPRTTKGEGDLVLPGIARDVRRIGDVFIVTRDAAPNEAEPEGSTLVTSLVASPDGRRLVARDEVVLGGRGASTAAAPSGVAIARPAPRALGPGRTAVTWVDVSDDDGGKLRARGTIAVAGVISALRAPPDSVVATDEDRVVRVYACSRACMPHEAAELAVIDFADPDVPRQTAALTIPGGNDATSRFYGNHLLLAHPLDDGATRLAVWRTTSAATSEGNVRLDGTVAGMIVRDARIVTIGWIGTPTTGIKATMHLVDLESDRKPKLRGSVSFGRDWTWSPAYDDERALTYDPGASLAAMPTTTTTLSGANQGKYETGAHVLAFEAAGPRLVEVVATERYHDRLLFARGRLYGFGADGVVTLAGGQPRVRSWHELEMNR